MSRREIKSPKLNEIDRLLRSVQNYKPARGEFDYATRGQAVAEAHQLYDEAFRLGKIFPMVPALAEASSEAHRLWFTAIDAAYPTGFAHDAACLHAGDTAGLESALAFLEADPFFFRTGYVKAELIRDIKRLTLTPPQERRLQQVVLNVVDLRDDRDFRAFCRLARKVDAPALREQLTVRLASGDAGIRRRARWVLEALAQKDSQERAAQKKSQKEKQR